VDDTAGVLRIRHTQNGACHYQRLVEEVAAFYERIAIAWRAIGESSKRSAMGERVLKTRDAPVDFQNAKGFILRQPKRAASSPDWKGNLRSSRPAAKRCSVT
jgi:hypothetical protein